MKLSIILVFGVFLSLNLQAKEKVETPSQKLLEKVLAENGIFRCSFTQTINSQLDGDKLKAQVRKNCKKEISTINKWYKNKAFKERADLLIGNGIRSASSHKKTL